MLGGYLPPLKAVALLAALLVGAYGTNAGLAACVLLLVFYALCTHVVVATTAWLAFTRRRVREISRIDDEKLKAFQSATLRLFDLPHHPRRLRQAVRRWRSWRAASARGDDDDAAFDGGGISRRRRRRFSSFASSVGALDATRGDGLRVLHDPTASGDGGDDAADAALRRRRARFGFAAAADDDGDGPDGDGDGDVAFAALESSSPLLNVPLDAVAKLYADHARVARVAPGEDVFYLGVPGRSRSGGVARECELCVLVSGAVAVGDEASYAGARPTIVRRRGAALNSLLDILEGSRGATDPEVEADSASATGVTSEGIKRLGAALEEASGGAAAFEAANEGGGGGGDGDPPGTPPR